MKPTIEIDIDALILRGFSMRDAYLIREAIEYQLTQHLQARGLSASLPTEIHLDQLTVRPIQLQTGYQAASVGHEVANTVFKGFNQLEKPTPNHSIT